MTLGMVWLLQSATGQPTTAGCGETAARHKHVPEKTSTSQISKLRQVVPAPDQPLDLLPPLVITHLETRALLSGQTSATAHVTADGAGPQVIPPSGTLLTRSADASDSQEFFPVNTTVLNYL